MISILLKLLFLFILVIFYPSRVVAFVDDFSSNESLENYLISTNSGSVKIESGKLILSANSNAKHYPLVKLKPGLAGLQAHDVNISFRYSVVGIFGAGIILDNFSPNNGESYDVGHNSIAWTWNWESPPKLRVGWYSFNYIDVPNQLEMHNLRVTGSPGYYEIYLDGTLIGITNSTKPITNIWFGNPETVATTNSWPVIEIDRITIDEELQDLPYLSQKDPLWKDIAYDSANEWAGDQANTIERWGCALTSAVMVLRYYGYTQLLDGAPLTPWSLNAWLLNQPDGYVAAGWVNWIALVRLTRLLRIEWSTPEKPLPQLRYVYKHWSDWQTEGLVALSAEIAEGRPAILQLPNHFIVANGFSTDGHDLHVLDPASDRTFLSDGFASPTSARLWQFETGDSELNLSYWLVIFPRGYRIKLLTADGVTITNWWLSQDLPGSVAEDSVSNRWLALTVPQPPDHDHLRIEIAPATGQVGLDGGEFPVVENLLPYQMYELQLYRYDAAANVTQQKIQSVMGTQPEVWDFSNTIPQSMFDWQNLERELIQLEQRDSLFPVVAARLRQIAQLAQMSLAHEQSESTKQRITQRYLTWFKNLFEQILTYDATLIGDEAKNYLKTLLNQQLAPSWD